MKFINGYVFILLSTIFMCSSTLAAIKTTNVGKITEINSFDDFGGGDVTIQFDSGLIECPQGVWITPNADGAPTMISFVLAAHMASKDVNFQVYDDRIWTGSSSNIFCQVDSVRIK